MIKQAKIIKVKSDSNPNKYYYVNCGPYECSCPAYQKLSAPWLKGEGYICKHMMKILKLDIPQETMLMVLEATDGDVETFLKNWTYTELLILYFRQLIYFINNDKLGVLK